MFVISSKIGLGCAGYKIGVQTRRCSKVGLGRAKLYQVGHLNVNSRPSSFVCSMPRTVSSWVISALSSMSRFLIRNQSLDRPSLLARVRAFFFRFVGSIAALRTRRGREKHFALSKHWLHPASCFLDPSNNVRAYSFVASQYHILWSTWTLGHWQNQWHNRIWSEAPSSAIGLIQISTM